MLIRSIKKKTEIEEIEREDEKIVIDNLEAAKRIYKQYVNDLINLCMYKEYTGFVEIFEPLIHKDGVLANFPGNGNYEDYIDKFKVF